MKRLLILGLSLSLMLVGCGENDNASSTESTNKTIVSANSSINDEQVENSNTSKVENTYQDVDREVLASPDQLKKDYKRLPEIEGITKEQIDKCMIADGTVVSVTDSPEYKSPGADKAIKITVNKNKSSAQVIFAEKLKEPLANGLDEAIVLDPVDGSLEGYEGIRFFLKVKRPEGKTHSELKIRFFFGSYSYYRSMYEYTTVLPSGDYEGYVEVPFDEMLNGYNGNKAVSITNIAYFAFNIQLEGNAENLETYISDFQAYRELYW